MSEKTAGKVGLIILFIALAIGSVFGFLYGFMGLAWTGDKGWIALIIGSVLAFIGAIFGLFWVGRSLRVPTKKKEIGPRRNTIIWSVIATTSAVGGVLFFFFGRRIIYNIWLFYIIIALLFVLFLISISALIFGMTKRTIAETKDFPVENTEEDIKEEIDDQ